MIAMKSMEGTAREHEEFRLNLENQRLMQHHAMDTQVKIAAEQSRVMGEAFKNAKIDIVGGDGAFFDRFVNAVSMGKSLDALVASSSTVTAVADDYVNGDRSLAGDIKDVLSRPAISAGDIKDLSISGLLASLASKADGAEKQKLLGLIEAAKGLGLK